MKLRLPHTYVLLFSLLLMASASTHFIPAGEYNRIERDGRQLVEPGSYHLVEPNPAGIDDVFMAFPQGLIEVAYIVFYIFIVGGAFGVIAGTGAIEAGINLIVRRLGNHQGAVVPVLTLIFAIGGGSFGMAEETLPFLPALVILSRSLGYDSVVGGAIALVGAGAGFAGAFLNPFTIGVAQGIAGLPLFSGVEFRLAVWAVLTVITMIFILRYAKKIKRSPQSSPVYAIDQKRPAVTADFTQAKLSRPQAMALLLSAVAFGFLIVGAMQWGWGINELSGLFFALAILAGPIGGLSLNDTAEKFIEGAASLAGGALVVGLARAILVVLSNARVIDTIMMSLSGAVSHLPAEISVVGIYVVQILLNFIVPSGSGQAALSIPILAPLSDLLGVTKQTMVLAYQFGDGFTNVFTPTQGYFMAGLALIRIPWHIWARWIFPLLLIWWGVGLVALLVAHAMRLGPF
ncbi:MAG: AbgT family transporter [candidate division KSB1 bacterium]|nr:AbgT family transporter [candidate division KSB1 bacterium]MDZ7364859.1 AbgT family transporter [candidate division KSB1 bacterium]MDZ7402962.1 AbgT family transporter [candidate division KSB1 bacterium]